MAVSGTGVGRSGAEEGRGAIPRPELFDVLSNAGRVTLVSAPAGSGKTFLVRAWVAQAGLAERVAWVGVGRGEHDAQRFWLAVLDALRATKPGSSAVGALTAAPELDGASIVERLLDDLTALEEPLWLVVDDLQELEAREAFDQLRLLVTEAPPLLKFVVLTRRDVRLGLHRLRLEGELTELRAADLRFTVDESRALFERVGVQLSDAALGKLVERTEGWAAGLRLAALSLAGNPDPERFAAEFSGSERTVAEYLLEEVLARQPPAVSRLLLRTSILERVSGPLADRLTGGSNGERILAELEEAGGFVVVLDPQRSWYRYHHLFADLLALELRRTAPEELPGLHAAAAEWLAEHGQPVEAIRHAQAAQDWRLATELLSEHWLSLNLDGRGATARELLAGFPPGAATGDAELAAVAAAAAMSRGSLTDADRYVALATSGLSGVAAHRRGRLEVTLSLLRLALARRRNDLQAVAAEAQLLLEPAEVSEEQRALALSELGIAEIWTGCFDQAERHLGAAMAAARRIDRPLIETVARSYGALLSGFRASPLAEERARQAVEVARAHGWTEEPMVAVAYVVLGAFRLWRGHAQDAEGWLERGQNALRGDVEPTVGLLLHASRGLLELTRGRDEQALAAFRAAERLDALLVQPHRLASRTHAHALVTLVRMGRTQEVEDALAALDAETRDTMEMRIALATLRLAQDDPEGVTAALDPVLGNVGADIMDRRWWIQGLVLVAIARDALRDPGGTSRALERALDLAEPEGLMLPFLIFPARELLERHRRAGTAHASLVADILTLLAGGTQAEDPGATELLPEPLSDSELRVLRYLPTNLQAPEIAGELYVSVNTVRTHMRHLYAKLGVHRRADAVQRARALGLLSPGAASR